MLLGEVFDRFAAESPVSVMARAAFEHALPTEAVDDLFAEHADRQYTRELLFSTTVDLMSVVALGLQPSVHAAAQARQDLPVSLAALYSKIKNTEPALGRALVVRSAQRLMPVLKELTSKRAPLCPGYDVRVLDGNHLAASEKRLAALRSLRGAALPGHSLVVYDPDLQMVIDLVPCEDAYAQERTLMPTLLAAARPGELWIADRNFSTTAILSGWHRQGAAFVVREHASSPHPTVLGELRQVGRVESGTVFEQLVQIGTGPEAVTLRRIELHLDRATEDGDKIIRLLSNLPDTKSAADIATLYRRRWTIENMFQWLESVLHSEVRTLGHPRAALFAFSVALLAFNVLSTIQVAVERQHDIPSGDNAGVSLYYVVNQIKLTHAGMMIAVPPDAWRVYGDLSDTDLGAVLLEIAAKVAPKTLRKHPRGPKKIVRKPDRPGYRVTSHHSTARTLAATTSAK